MIGSMSLHRVTNVVLEDAKYCHDGYSRHLMIRLDDGTEIELILFGHTKENLDVRPGTYSEFFKKGIEASVASIA